MALSECVLPSYGPSMFPTICPGDQLSVQFTDELRRGDIAVYRKPPQNTFVAHRVIGMSATAIWVRGDNIGKIDLVSREDIVGRVKKIIRPSGMTNDLSSVSAQVQNKLWLIYPRGAHFLRRQLNRLAGLKI